MLSYRTHPGEQHDRRDRRKVLAIGTQPGVDHAVEEPRGVARQSARRRRGLGINGLGSSHQIAPCGIATEIFSLDIGASPKLGSTVLLME